MLIKSLEENRDNLEFYPLPAHIINLPCLTIFQVDYRVSIVLNVNAISFSSPGLPMFSQNRLDLFL